MSTRVKIKIQLVADGEPGTGLGTELVNDLVSRDHRGRPVLRARHIKGLMRDRLAAIGDALGWRDRSLDTAVFGRPGQEGDDGAIGMIRVGDASVESDVRVRATTRTALDDLGTAAGTTLRTAEAIPAGTTFFGVLAIDAPKNSAVDLATRLALLAIDAVGGGRSRGCGACTVSIDGDSRTPGALLRELGAALASDAGRAEFNQQGPARAATVRSAAAGDSKDMRFYRLLFRAEGPVCCPEVPAVGNSVVRSGLAVPASAVQGAIITRLARESTGLADACLDDPRFRAWPLLPCAPADAQGDAPVPVRVSLSHRMSKLPIVGDTHEFQDIAIEPYDWRKTAAGSPLKAADGVLLRPLGGVGEAAVSLWRAVDIPRMVTAHAVHHDPDGTGRRNLFTVEAVAPLLWSGWIAMPPEAANALIASLTADPHFAFGQARGVSGAGHLQAIAAQPDDLAGLSLTGELAGRIFVLQSPAAIPDAWSVNEASEVLQRLLQESGWGPVAPRPTGAPGVRAFAECGVRFGWNRHGKGISGSSHRISGRRVILPGSVFVLAEKPADVAGLLVNGLGVGGDGRPQGFGSVLPHPGKARACFRQTASDVEIASRDQAGREALELWRLSGSDGPSASQIGALLDQLNDRKKAVEYLRRQNARPSAIAHRWRDVTDAVEGLINKSPDPAKVLRVWQDLAIAHRDDQEDRR